jgi:anti-anti-sigma factor
MTVARSWYTQSWLKSGSAEFAVRTHRSVTAIAAHGELDAANANQLTECVERYVRKSGQLVVDLRELDFFGTAGFSALHRINVVCSGAGAQWLLIPGDAVRRVLRICDPDGALPSTASPLSDGLGLLQLVPQPR